MLYELEVDVKFDYKGLAIVVLVVGIVVAVAYNMGMKQGQQTAQLAQHQQQVPAAHPVQPAPATPTPRQMPANHPSSLQLGRAAGANFTHFRVGNRNVKGMLADGDLVWVGTSGGIIRYDIKTDDYKLFDVNNGSLLSNGVFHVSKLGDQIVVGTYGGGMSVFNTSTNQWKNYNIPDGLADQFVYDLVKTTHGDVWIATWSGANLVHGGNLDDPKAWETFNVANTNGGLPNDWVYGVEEGKNGELWFATEGGLARYKDGKWEHWQHEDGLGAPYEDVKDAIAFSNDPAKMSQHHAQQKAEQGLNNIKVGYNPNYIVSLAVDDEGVVWCGTWGGGLAKFDGKTWTNITTKNGLPGNHIFMLKYDEQDKRLWIGTNRGLARPNKSGKGYTVMTKNDGLFADNVFSFAKAQDGTLWVGSFGGVSRLSNVQL
jgi:hypothetical protein